MSRLVIKVHAEAEAEISVARDWYAARSVVAAAGFLEEVEHGLEWIAAEPFIGPPDAFNTRSYLVRRYPYIIVYDVLSRTFTSSLSPIRAAARAIGKTAPSNTERSPCPIARRSAA